MSISEYPDNMAPLWVWHAGERYCKTVEELRMTDEYHDADIVWRGVVEMFGALWYVKGTAPRAGVLSTVETQGMVPR